MRARGIKSPAGENRRLVAQALAANPGATTAQLQAKVPLNCKKLMNRYLNEVGVPETIPGGAHLGKRWWPKPTYHAPAAAEPVADLPDLPRDPSPHRWHWRTDGMGRVIGLNPLPPVA